MANANEPGNTSFNFVSAVKSLFNKKPNATQSDASTYERKKLHFNTH